MTDKDTERQLVECQEEELAGFLRWFQEHPDEFRQCLKCEHAWRKSMLEFLESAEWREAFKRLGVEVVRHDR